MLNGGTLWKKKTKTNATTSAKRDDASFRCADNGHVIAYECNIFRLLSFYLFYKSVCKSVILNTL